MSDTDNKNLGGRPRMFNTVEEMQVLIDRYFQDCKKDNEPLTITGLALALGFTSRQAVMNYEGFTDNNGRMFLDTIKTAKLRIENAYEKRNIENGRGGDIFALKQFDWTDKQEIKHSGEMNLNNKTIYAEMSDEELRKVIANADNSEQSD